MDDNRPCDCKDTCPERDADKERIATLEEALKLSKQTATNWMLLGEKETARGIEKDKLIDEMKGRALRAENKAEKYQGKLDDATNTIHELQDQIRELQSN